MNASGVYGEHSATGYALAGRCTAGSSTCRGVYGEVTSDSGSVAIFGVASAPARAGVFSGNVQVTGSLSKGGGSFKIDHPLDPENKYLYHSFVESPDMMNIYNGVAVLDAVGEATVDLPEWFEALNREFRYQLTAIGAAAAESACRQEIAGNRFLIAGGRPGMKVSWQVTGIRKDACADAPPHPGGGTQAGGRPRPVPASHGARPARGRRHRVAAKRPTRRLAMITSRSFASILFASSICLGARFAAASSWTIPGIVNAGGLNNTHFVSDFTATNPGTVPTQVTISFFPSSSESSRDGDAECRGDGRLPGHRRLALRDVGRGRPLDLLGPAALPPGPHLQHRLERDLRVALPVYEDERLLTPGETGDSLWISQDASGSLRLSHEHCRRIPGCERRRGDRDRLRRRRQRAWDEDLLAGRGRVSAVLRRLVRGGGNRRTRRIHVTRGRAAGYGVVVDNVTGDSSLFTFEDLPGGQTGRPRQRSRAREREERNLLRTDARFYNSTDTEATVTVAFHAAGNANPAPATASFTLPAGKIRDVVDVLDALLGLPVGSSGALRFTSDWPIAILCRTSNVDPFGVKPGTFGSQQKPVPLLSFLTSADAGAVVAGIRQNAAFRTNIGICGGSGWRALHADADDGHGGDRGQHVGRSRSERLDPAQRPGNLPVRHDPGRCHRARQGQRREPRRLRLLDRQRLGRRGRDTHARLAGRDSGLGHDRPAGRLDPIG